MDYGNTGQGGLNLFDPEMAVEMSSLQTPLQTLPRMNIDWDGGFPELTNQPAGPPGGVYPAPTAMAYPHVGGDIGFGGLCGPVPGAFDALAGTIGGGGGGSSSSIGVKPEGMLAIAHNSTRAARNGREQQRAQKISDVIDKLKGMLDKAKFTTGDASSKLHVLVSCESYIRNLQDRTRCHEMEAKLRSAASGNQYSADTTTTSTTASGGSKRAGARATRSSNDIEWTKKSDRARRSNASQRGETDGCTSSSGADGGSSSRSSSSSSSGGGSNSSSSGGSSSSSDGDCTKKVDAFFDEESSSTTSSSSAAEESRAFGRGVATRSARRAAAADSAGSASSSVEEDGDTGSSGDSSGGDTLAGTTTDSRGFTTDSSFSGDSGSADSGDSGSADSGDTGSGDTGSADGGSDGSEEGAASARMRVVNYFDIFRLSNVPMAIADKEGALVDVNDAMRGFGRIDQDTVKTLTVNSLVAPESSKALEDAMSEMLAASSVPQETPGPPQGGSQPFLANAGIGNRRTVLTVSLVYDERGEASAFHVALIPVAQKLQGKSSANCGRSSTEYNGEAPGLCVDEAQRGNGGKDGTCASATGKRSVRVWDSRERTTSQKRPATIKHQQSFSS